MKIPYVNIQKQYESEKKQLLKIIDNVLISGKWVGGSEVDKFENNISKICKTKYCVSLNSGTDALTLALHLLGVKRGDEVITPPNSFIASTAVIVHLGAKPVFVDVKSDQSIDEKKIEEQITNKTNTPINKKVFCSFLLSTIILFIKWSILGLSPLGFNVPDTSFVFSAEKLVFLSCVVICLIILINNML